MRTDQPQQWSGLDLSPLPYESSLSILWRFGSRNVLSFTQIKQVLKNSSVTKNARSFFGKHWIDTTSFSNATNWNLPPASECLMFEHLGMLVPIWFTSNFRFCPLCLEHSYHSIWFQFRPMNHCPLHGCALQSDCQSCDAKLGEYNLSKDFFQQPYYCAKCEKPISGVVPELQLHLEFRDHFSEIDNVFQPLSNWLMLSDKKFIPMRKLLEQNLAWQSAWSQWCQPLEFLLSIGHHLHPLPKYCTQPLYSSITDFNWHVPLKIGNGAGAKKHRIALLAKPYQELISGIFVALASQFPEVQENLRAICLSRNLPVELWKTEVHQLAYEIFRMKAELGDRISIKPTCAPQMRDELMSYLPWSICEIPANVLRANFFSMYVNIVHALKKSRAVPTLNLNNLDLRDQVLVPQAWWQEGEYIIGVSFFPTIENAEFNLLNY